MKISHILWVALLTVVVCSCKSKAEKQAEEDELIIQDYITSNNLDAIPTGSGLYYVIDQQGTGLNPTIYSTITVAYNGYLTNGSGFDQSDSARFPLANLIQGWQEGFPYFKEGGSGKLLIPSALGYGAQSIGNIPANSVLIFDVELKRVE